MSSQNLTGQDEPLDVLINPDLAPLFWTPERLDKSSAWWGHVPFAFWLTTTAKPHLLVELGTHNGVSYAAFCEAVARAGIGTRCYGIDQWPNNLREGIFGNAVYEELKDFHDERYAAFSILLRQTNDEALPSFEDRTIDLLHIDGCRAYEPVLHDIKSWWPKLSKNAAILFHGTKTRSSDIDGWRVFDELKQNHLCFEFTHGHGLGVIIAGSEPCAAVKTLCSLTGSSDIAYVRERFAYLGARWAITASDTAATISNRHLSEKAARLESALAEKDAQVREYIYHLQRIGASPWWRLGKMLEAVVAAPARIATKLFARKSPAPQQTWAPDRSYRKWIELYDTITNEDRRQIKDRLLTLAYQPLISIIMPAYETPEALLREALQSVCNQLYPNWELCVADDASPSATVSEILQDFAAREPRIKWMRRESNGHISAASNSALALATGEFVALMDHDDVLAEHALFEVVAELNAHPDADLIYSDEDRIDGNGVRRTPYFKTDWNPELFLGQNLICHLGVYRRALVEKIGGFRPGLEGAQDYDLALRMIAATSADRIRHIPSVLYHWRGGAKTASFSESQLQRCIAAAKQAKADYFSARNETVRIMENPIAPTWERIRRPVPAPAPLVSLIVPTRNRHDLLAPCIEGLLHRTAYELLEIIIIDHASDEPETLALLNRLKADARVRIMPYEGPFNYSDMNNRAVAAARGDIIGLINNDIDVIDPNWLSEMVSLATVPDYGAIGAKLLYPDDRIQHAGVIVGLDKIAGHACLHADRNATGYFGRLAMTTNVSAVTGACLIVRKELFDSVGGLNAEDLPVAYSDVDLCLKLRAKGYRNVWTPFALLYHHESPSRGSDEVPEKVERAQREIDYMWARWGEALTGDPYFNLNLSLQSLNFDLAFPPRRIKPWKQ